MNKEMEDKIREILSENATLEVPVENIGLEDDLFKIGLDSINSIQVIVAIESVFDIEFEDEDLVDDNVRSIRSIINYLESRV